MTFREFECALGWEIAGRILALRASGSANEVGARLFEGRGGAPLDEMEIGIPYDILRLLAADAAPGKSVHWRGPDIRPQGQR
jgi:hypothetical protein